LESLCPFIVTSHLYLLFGSVIQSWTGRFVNALGGEITKLWY